MDFNNLNITGSLKYKNSDLLNPLLNSGVKAYGQSIDVNTVISQDNTVISDITDDNGSKYNLLDGLETKILTDTQTQIKNIIVSVLRNSSDNTPLPTIDLTLDGGDYQLTSQTINNVINVSNLTSDNGTYKLKLKFNLFNDPQTNTWINKTDSNFVRAEHGCSNFSDGLCAGGKNTLTDPMNEIEKYTYAANSWVNRTYMNYSRKGLVSAGMTSDLLICTAGLNVSVYGGWNERYSNNSNSWTNRSTRFGAYGIAGNALTNTKVFHAGGYNGEVKDFTYLFNEPFNAWYSKAVITTPRYSQASYVYDNDKVFHYGGYNESVYLNVNEMYSESTNTWTTSVSGLNRSESSGASLSEGTGLFIGGNNGSVLDNNQKFDPKVSAWTSKTGLSIKQAGGCVINSHTSLINGGYNTDYTNSTQCYIDGETVFHGFSVQIL